MSLAQSVRSYLRHTKRNPLPAPKAPSVGRPCFDGRLSLPTATVVAAVTQNWMTTVELRSRLDLSDSKADRDRLRQRIGAAVARGLIEIRPGIRGVVGSAMVRRGSMKSIAQKLAQVEGLLGTDDLSPWEQRFVQDLCERTPRNGSLFDTSGLSTKQVETIDRIYGKHFA